MAKTQSFADKVKKQRGAKKKMVKLVISELKDNGHYSFRTRMVAEDQVKDEIAAAKK